MWRIEAEAATVGAVAASATDRWPGRKGACNRTRAGSAEVQRWGQPCQGSVAEAATAPQAVLIIEPPRRWPQKEKGPRGISPRAFHNPGGVLLSHAVTRAVSLAMQSLTAVFGMGTGVTSAL